MRFRLNGKEKLGEMIEIENAFRYWNFCYVVSCTVLKMGLALRLAYPC